MQILHCIEQSESGGESSVSDGVSALLEMRRTHPRWFRLLATVPVTFHRKQKAVDRKFVGPIAICDSNGTPRQVRASYFSLAPFTVNFDEMADFYAAYSHFTNLLRSPRFCLTTQLHSGDYLLYDNYRMLHARTAFVGTKRWFRGVYVDKEQVERFLTERVEAHGDTWGKEVSD